MTSSIRVTVWNEFRHEKTNEAVMKVYPDGMHNVIARGLSTCPELELRTATLDEPEHGLLHVLIEKPLVHTVAICYGQNCCFLYLY